ncbi:hypothetical protein CES85_2071 [Ochrobactrum quorumnocens]|uniref:Uncharacterized protein n=1 Tax=Ochrobactrum quorumnocens TaxID=271865 RepID=A0A248UFQ5_9HYPH|nr:hypothetical protein CES85_2071 [[Ochrobactrum] quorumnocens]
MVRHAALMRFISPKGEIAMTGGFALITQTIYCRLLPG